jgi:predicted metal-dependent hydrolase
MGNFGGVRCSFRFFTDTEHGLTSVLFSFHCHFSAIVVVSNMSVHPDFLRGARLFDACSFFEAHDVWEELWMETSGGSRVFYQGMIQTAVAYYHAANNNGKGAVHLLDRSMVKLERFLPSFEGVDLIALLRVLKDHHRFFLDGLEHGSISLPVDCPKLGL